MILSTLLLCALSSLIWSSSAISATESGAAEGQFELDSTVKLEHGVREAERVDELVELAATPTRALPTAPLAQIIPTPWKRPDNKLTWNRLVNGRHYEDRYVYLSSILEQTVPEGSGLDAHLAEAREWLELERRGKVGFGNRATVEALEQFLELGKLGEDETRCSFKAYEILYKNDQATGGRAHQAPSKTRPLTRIDRLVHLASRRHTEACFEVYPRRFHELSQQLRAENVDAFDGLREFMDQVLGCTDCISSKVRDLRDSRAERASEHAYKLIERHSARDKDLRQDLVRETTRRRPMINGRRVRALVQRHIVEPCRAYVQLLGPNVFVPALFAVMVLESPERYRPSESQHRDFLHGWLHYRLCESLIRRDQTSLILETLRMYRRVLRAGNLKV